MSSNIVDISTGEIVEPMSKEEAQQTTEQIKRGARMLRDGLVKVYDAEGWKALGYPSMNQYLEQEFKEFSLSPSSLLRELQAGRTERNLISHRGVPTGTGLRERVLRPIATSEFIEQPEAQREILQIAIDSSNAGKPTAKDVERAKKVYQQKPKQEYRAVFNRVNDNIEWAMWSWNPVTGCLHGCEYCYARDIANRFYPQGFEPMYHPERLAAPKNTKLDARRWDGDIGYKGVFVCSMADLFGKWVPSEWIEGVLDSVRNNPQWNFLFLTKFPIRMAEFEYPTNAWLGTTVDKQWSVERAEKGFRRIKDSGFTGICWLSCEPMLERITFSSMEMFDWVIMGGGSKSSKTPEYKPPFDDIYHLHHQVRNHNLPIYQKTNLLPGLSNDQRIREYPSTF